MSILQNIEDSEACLITTNILKDKRGDFTKIFQNSYFHELDGFSPNECYISTSKKNVLRGFHLQLNESIHGKIVSCLSGEVLDVFVDLRKNGTFGKVYSKTLSSKNRDTIFIPKGYGHAFLNLDDEDATLLYLVETEHTPKNDTGVKWDSVDFEWPIASPIISDRDNKLVEISKFKPI